MRLSVPDAARLLRVSEKTIYRWIKQGVLPAYRVSDQYRFNAAELLAWATSRRLNVSARDFHEVASTAGPLPSLDEALQAGGIFYRLEGDSQELALRSLVEHARLGDETDRNYLHQVLMAREELGTTAVGDGIAMPELLFPTSLEIRRPTLVLGYLEHPLEWGALDGRPVDTLLAILAPQFRMHLHLHGRLAFALRNPDFAMTLRRQGRREEILELLRAFEAGLPVAPGAPGSPPAPPAGHPEEPTSTEAPLP